MFELAQLRGFVAVAEELHFHRAAVRLHMSQPPLTRQIQMLEHEVGFRLLERSSRSVRLTPAGAVFLAEARRLLQMAAGSVQAARRVALGEAGAVTLGFTAASGYAVLPRVVALIRARLPEVELNLRELVTQEQVQALQAGQLDLGLLRPPLRQAGLRGMALEREALLVALPLGHPLTQEQEVPVAALDGLPLITYPPVEGRYLHDAVLGAYRAAGIAPSRVQHISQTHSILPLVGIGLGIALVPQAAARLCPSDVALRPLAAQPAIRVELVFAWREDTANPACAAVRQLLREEWPAPPERGTPTPAP
ncbi:LysR family transcriptional regulator [Roseomonas sp. OT10]|uniref:LysR family transcriptional regulator n=1 Tax=Roseomonas cutis TaxID=2897332 RepID=UPI001E2D6146|nr:LysR family transcriptional regulator [Roseomonas sp. OT10]UFN50169.1 LysR family transcriptional regulator [Roseomonas sp. OT10]